MIYTRRLMRHALGASAVTLLVPGGILAALLVSALGNGFGGLGSLRQVVGGPVLPTVSRLHTPALATPTLPSLPSRPAARGAGGAAAPSSPRGAGAVPSGSTAGTGPGAAPPAASPRSLRPHRPVSAPPPAPGRSTGGPSPSSPPTPAPSPGTPGPLQQVGSAAQSLVSPVPAVGPAAAGAVGSVIGLLGGHSR